MHIDVLVLVGSMLCAAVHPGSLSSCSLECRHVCNSAQVCCICKLVCCFPLKANLASRHLRCRACLQDANRLYLVLEFCAGGDLGHYLRRYRQVSEATARYFLQQVAEGLKELRRHNVIHVSGTVGHMHELHGQPARLQTACTPQHP